MRFLIALSLAALSLSASTVDARTPMVDRGFLSAICAGENVPFALPSFDVSEDWADTEYEMWIDVRWTEYCAHPVTATAQAACECTGHKVAR